MRLKIENTPFAAMPYFNALERENNDPNKYSYTAWQPNAPEVSRVGRLPIIEWMALRSVGILADLFIVGTYLPVKVRARNEFILLSIALNSIDHAHPH